MASPCYRSNILVTSYIFYFGSISSLFTLCVTRSLSEKTSSCFACHCLFEKNSIFPNHHYTLNDIAHRDPHQPMCDRQQQRIDIFVPSVEEYRKQNSC